MIDALRLANLLKRLGYPLTGLLVLTLTGALTYWVLNRSRVSAWFKGSQDFATTLIGIPSILFALFTTTLASDVWSRYQKANDVLIIETSAMRGIMAASLNISDGKEHLLNAVENYALAVVKTEWPAMVVGDHSGKETALRELRQLSTVCLNLGGRKDQPAVIATRLLQSMDAIRTSRLQRLSLAHDAISPTKWEAILLFGMLVVFTVGIVHIRRPRAMGIAMSVAVICVVGTIYVLSSNRNPYAGPSAILPTTMVEALYILEQSETPAD